MKPVPITLEEGAIKYQGFIMKITHGGMLVELEKITFKVGTFLTALFALDDGPMFTERVRSIKHYDRFFRSAPKKRKTKTDPDDLSPESIAPKKLCELHFQMLSEANKVLITKFLIEQQKKK